MKQDNNVDKTILQVIGTGAMLHDIGKFSERAGALDMGDKDMVQQEYRYAHAHHTEIALKTLFADTQLEKTFGGSVELTVLNLAARHHKPRNIYEHIVSQADRIASGHERTTGDEISEYDTGGRERKRQTPLLSILSRIQLKNREKTSAFDWRYRITGAGVAADAGSFSSFFPVPKNQYTYDQVEQDYVTQWNLFFNAVRPDSGVGLDRSPEGNSRTCDLSLLFPCSNRYLGRATVV